MYRIMIVEDNEEIQNELVKTLEQNGYATTKVYDFQHLMQEIKGQEPHLILLDINLPGKDGFQLCTEIRSFSKVPIIFVTSRNDTIDELMSMRLGGDDFITKPYHTQILLARIDAVLKRVYPNQQTLNILEHRGVVFNPLASSLAFEGKEIELTKNEMKILHYLLKRKGEVVSRLDIMEHLWDSALFINDNTLTVNIARIRQKCEELGVSEFIKTKRGQGYML